MRREVGGESGTTVAGDRRVTGDGGTEGSEQYVESSVIVDE